VRPLRVLHEEGLEGPKTYLQLQIPDLPRLRDVLPGRYAFGLTGRDPDGKILAEGPYVLRLRAHPVDGDDGAQPSTAEAVFTIER